MVGTAPLAKSCIFAGVVVVVVTLALDQPARGRSGAKVWRGKERRHCRESTVRAPEILSQPPISSPTVVFIVIVGLVLLL